VFFEAPLADDMRRTVEALREWRGPRAG